jgi:hypothetical protein
MNVESVAPAACQLLTVKDRASHEAPRQGKETA